MSAYVDRVMETSTTTGNSDVTLAGAITGFITFNTGFGTSVPFFYTIEGVDASNVPTGEWEVGMGHLSDATTLVRDLVLASSNSNAVVTLSAGTKNVFNSWSALAAQAAYTNSLFNLQFGTL